MEEWKVYGIAVTVGGLLAIALSFPLGKAHPYFAKASSNDASFGFLWLIANMGWLFVMILIMSKLTLDGPLYFFERLHRIAMIISFSAFGLGLYVWFGIMESKKQNNDNDRQIKKT